MTISEGVRARRSVRKYKPDVKVTDAQIESLMEAAMMAPSAMNTRPWEFYVVESREKLNAIMDVQPYTKMLATAPACIVVCALNDPKKEGSTEPNLFYQQDCAAATQNILLQALDLGLGTCWCAVAPHQDQMDGVRKIIGAESTPFCIIALGVPDESPAARGLYEPQRVKKV